MKSWTYAEARAKIEVDLDLEEEDFVKPNELIGYFNEGIEEAESEILKIDEDYFITSMPLPLVEGTSAYDYPEDIYAFKVRGLTYANGSVIYKILRFRRNNKFELIAFANQYSQAEDYRWFPTNDRVEGPKINLSPAARETAIVPPNTGTFMPVILDYIRHANRIPLIGEYVDNYEKIVQSSSTVDLVDNELTVTGTYAQSDQVTVSSTGTLPGGLYEDTVYYVIGGDLDDGLIKLAESLEEAEAGTPITLTSIGSGVLTISIAATQAIVDNTIIDIPEFTKFVIQWAKCRCMEKEGDPRLAGAAATLTQQKEQMVSTLTEMQQDDQNEIEPDFSSYTEMS